MIIVGLTYLILECDLCCREKKALDPGLEKRRWSENRELTQKKKKKKINKLFVGSFPLP
jgi:hypothetical protein